MSPKGRRVSYHLDAKGVRSLPQEEVKVILRGADGLIMKGGRTLLAKLLKGSRQQDVLKLGLDRNPACGCYRDLSPDDIRARIDWVIGHGYLDIKYDYRLPLLVFTDAGWAIEKETITDELLRGFDDMLAKARPPYDMSYLKDRNRGMILLLLDKVAATKDPKYIPLLEAWGQIDYRKIQARIRRVIRQLTKPTDDAVRPTDDGHGVT